jgi:hypothetical protein
MMHEDVKPKGAGVDLWPRFLSQRDTSYLGLASEIFIIVAIVDLDLEPIFICYTSWNYPCSFIVFFRRVRYIIQ